MIKHYKLGVLIGEPAGSSFKVNDNAQRFTGSQTKAAYQIARTTFYTTAASLREDEGVAPDLSVPVKLEHIISRHDPIMAAALAKANKTD